MKLNKLTNRIYFLEHDPEADRPMLAYLKGDKLSLAVDAGYSADGMHTKRMVIMPVCNYSKIRFSKML